jgi:hypothetical protein
VLTQTDRKRKWLFYTPGLVSLIFFPMLCFFYFNNHHVFDIRVREVVFCNPELYKSNPDIYVENYPKREYVDINLTGDDREDKIKLNYAQLKIRELVLSKDSIKGVHFHFDDKAKYWTLIRAFDICEIENEKNYLPYQNDIWVTQEDFCRTPITEFYGWVCGTIDPYNEMIRRREKINIIINTAKEFWVSGFLFIFMTILTIIKLWKA